MPRRRLQLDQGLTTSRQTPAATEMWRPFKRFPEDFEPGTLQPYYEPSNPLMTALEFALPNVAKAWKGEHHPNYPIGQDILGDILGFADAPVSKLTPSVLGPLLLKGRESLLQKVIKPSIEKLGGKKAAKRFVERFSKDVPEENVALKALDEMMEASDVPKDSVATYGIEWEGRNKLPISEMKEKLRGRGYKLDSKNEPVMKHWREYEPYFWPQEITGEPLWSWDDIVHFATEGGPFLDRYHRGGPWGGAGHLNVSWPDMTVPDVRALMKAWFEAEPWIYPTRSAARPSQRNFVEPLVATHPVRGGAHNIIWLEDFPDLTSWQGYGPSRNSAFNVSNLGLHSPDQQRIELRAFASPETSEQWIENMLLSQSLRNRAMHGGASIPETLDEMLTDQWENVIAPDLAELRAFHEQQITPEGVERWLKQLGYTDPLSVRKRKVIQDDPWLAPGGYLSAERYQRRPQGVMQEGSSSYRNRRRLRDVMQEESSRYIDRAVPWLVELGVRHPRAELVDFANTDPTGFIQFFRRRRWNDADIMGLRDEILARQPNSPLADEAIGYELEPTIDLDEVLPGLAD